MDEGTKRHFDALSMLWKGRWENFNQRRIYEWKFCIVIWTAFVVFIGNYIFANNKPDDLSELVSSICWIGGIVSLAHIMWLYGLGLKNNRDKMTLWAYERQMRGILNTISSLPDATENPDRTGRPLLNIHHGPQVLMTLVLYAAAILTVADLRLAILCAVIAALAGSLLANRLASHWPELLD